MARVAAQTNAPDEAAVWRAAALRARLKIGVLLRQSLAQLQIDPTRVAMLRVCDEAAQELALSADGPAPSADPAVPAGERHGDDPAAVLAARVGVLVSRYSDGEAIDFAKASLAETLAWCSARLGSQR